MPLSHMFCACGPHARGVQRGLRIPPGGFAHPLRPATSDSIWAAPGPTPASTRKKNIAKTILPSGSSLTKRLNTERPHGKTKRKAKTKAGDNEQTPIRAVLGTAREVGADQGSGAFERTLSSLAPPKERPEKSQGPMCCTSATVYRRVHQRLQVLPE